MIIKNNNEEVSALGCLAAYEWESYVVSFSSDHLWMDEFINGIYLSIENSDRKIKVRNFSTEEHVENFVLEQKRKDKLMISSGKELWEKREILFPHLIFCECVKKQLEEARVSLHIEAIINRIQILEDYFAIYEGDFDKERVGYGCRSESESVHKDLHLRNMRKFMTPYGTEEYFYWHISFPGNYPGRIHFLPDQIHKKGIIGYVGKHLPTRKYPTV